jgi:TRAP-type C4-dicarboxylate transport system permease small subunit
MLRRIVQTMDLLSDWVGHLMGWLVFLLMALILVEVFTRYVLPSAPIAVADEMGGYALVAVTFLGLGYTWKEGGHVRVEFLVNVLPRGLQRALRLFTLLIATVFAAVMIKASYDMVSFTVMFGTRSGSWLRIPMQWPQLSLIVGSTLLFLQLLAELVKALVLQGTTAGERS